jgi:hypothetical protein
MTIRAGFIAPSNYPNHVETDRQILDEQASGTPGVFFDDATPTGLQVSAGSGHTVDVAVGRALCRNKSNPTQRGMYYFNNDSIENVALPADGAQAFYATVIARVADPQYETVTGDVGGRFDVISGTQSGSPTAVSDSTIDAISNTPGGWTRLADILINPGDSGAIPGGQITDKRRPGGFGVIPCLSTNRPVPGRAGVMAVDLDTTRVVTWDGAAWKVTGDIQALPAQVVTVDANVRTFTASTNTWADLSTNVTAAITNPSTTRDLRVHVTFGAWMSIATSGDTRMCCVASGGITIADGPIGSSGEGAATWGEIPLVGNTAGSHGASSGFYATIPAGASAVTFKLRAQRSAANTTNINYPFLRVTPVCYL